MKLLLWAVGLGTFLSLTAQADKKVVCYVSTSSFQRPGNGKFTVGDIDPFLCTHVILGFAGLDPDTCKIAASDLHDTYRSFNSLRQENPSLKTLLSVGGTDEAAAIFSKMAANSDLRRIFIDSVVAFLQLPWEFSGLDIHWDYPLSREGNKQYKANFIVLLKELRQKFDKHGWLLTAAVGSIKEVIDSAYDIPEINRYLDFINVKAFDFHGPLTTFARHHSPMNARPTESEHDHFLTVNYSMNYWLKQGASRDKLILGVAMYGRSFTLASNKQTDAGAAAIGPGTPGPYTKQSGILGYNEICETQSRWKVVQDPYYQAPYAYSYKQWVSYDDLESVRRKGEFVNSLGLGGAMVWSLDTDDFKGSCLQQNFPLTNAIKQTLNPETQTQTPVAPETTLLVETRTPQPPVANTHTPQPPIMDTDAPLTSPFVTNTPNLPSLITDIPSTPLVVTDTPKPPVVVTTTTTTTPQVPTVAITTKRPDVDCPSVGVFRDRFDCSKFHYCEFYRGFLIVTGWMKCPIKGLYFDEVSKSCKWASEVDCDL